MPDPYAKSKALHPSTQADYDDPNPDEPHEHIGQLGSYQRSRWCAICGRIDFNPIHRLEADTDR